MTSHTGELAGQLRRHRRRITPQRALVCRLLEGNAEHPSAEVLHRRAIADMPTLSLRTVYAILHELVEVGAVQPLDLGTGSTRFDPNPRPHHHTVCTRCGRVRDVHMSVAPMALPPDQQQGFWVRSMDLIFRGLCEECRR
jgi:Fe2+ or Zn2+ uptake regulation protein